ncbi:uncharacterized protein GGS25DRAFT_253353 [Hypoxylon fragiforme]|uniref:uncharacterized protein n=1 Tax=Hypoxylon fragiforme TaxID=63214 RepID=UPI0020C5B83F|nr:uncharacterized protein GGS25DRAFT_253353 [Hypoxylon fragiforme]KAI2610237.1 hypothetical protein GGS25DRAFT_253353 [Hypoxylon fragiforme]
MGTQTTTKTMMTKSPTTVMMLMMMMRTNMRTNMRTISHNCEGPRRLQDQSYLNWRQTCSTATHPPSSPITPRPKQPRPEPTSISAPRSSASTSEATCCSARTNASWPAPPAPISPPLTTTAFGVVTNGSEARIYMSWRAKRKKAGRSDKFIVCLVENFLLEKRDEYLKLRMCVLNIVRWGLEREAEMVKAVEMKYSA